MKESRHCAVVICGLLWGAGSAGAGESPVPPAGAFDRVAAFVDGEPLLESEIRAVIDLRLVPPTPEESPEHLRRRVLDVLVDDRLRAKDLARFGEPEIPADDVENEIDHASLAVGGRERFLAIALADGLDGSAIRSLFRRQLAALEAAEERFGGSVFVEEREIAEFLECDEELRERLRASGVGGTPKVTPEISAEVRRLIAERRLSAQLDAWMTELRKRARIEIVPEGVP